MHLIKKTEQVFEKFKNLPVDKLIKIRKSLDDGLYENKFYVVGFNSPIPMHFNPIILSKHQKEELFYKSKIIINAIKKITEEYYHSEELQKLIKIDPFEKKLFLNFQKPKGFGVMRLDAFWDGKKLQFVELNSDYPDGIIMLQNACDVYDRIMDKNNILNKNKFDKFDNKKLFYDNLIALYKLNGGEKKFPVVAVVAPRGRAGDNEYQLMVDYLVRMGHEAFHVEPKDLKQLKDGSLLYKNIKIDVIRRSAEIRYFKLQKGGEKIFDAYKKGKAVFINSFHDRLWGVKSIFALLHDKKFQYLFNEEEKEIIKETIPTTYIITSNKDRLKDEIYWRNKNDFVLKPSDMSEGEGIVFGKNLSSDEWQKLISSKKCIGWIVQKKVTIKKRKILVIKNNKKVTKRLYSDIIIHIFMDKKERLAFGNIGNRTSSSVIVNVAKGGGINQVKVLKI